MLHANRRYESVTPLMLILSRKPSLQSSLSTVFYGTKISNMMTIPKPGIGSVVVRWWLKRSAFIIHHGQCVLIHLPEGINTFRTYIFYDNRPESVTCPVTRVNGKLLNDSAWCYLKLWCQLDCDLRGSVSMMDTEKQHLLSTTVMSFLSRNSWYYSCDRLMWQDSWRQF